jgi:amino acid adenylation domain-containing protein
MIIKKFEEQVARFAKKTAVVTETAKLTYEDVNLYANRVAHAILESDPGSDKNGKNQIVGLLFEHSSDMIVAVLGTLKGGKAYLPLDITYPKNRLAYMVEDSETSLVLTNNNNLPLAEKLAANVKTNLRIINIEPIIIDTDMDGKHKSKMENIERDSSGDRLAYILYTSGSTGRPKGVIQNQRNVCYYIKNWTERFSITHEDRMTLFTAFSHDGAGQDMFGALHNGATLYPYNILSRPNIAGLIDWLKKEKITIWHSVPTIYRYFVNALEDRGLKSNYFPHLRFILLGGEQVRDHDIRMFKRFFPNAVFANVYGQTESSVSSIWLVRPEDPVNKMLIGEPLDKTEILIVDEEGEILEDLGIGEIVVACDHISPGYWNNEESSKERFFDDPELGRLYRTGDLGRLMADGNIECMGRKDSQVKIRGFRIETGEIETMLLNHKAIKEAVVETRSDTNGNVHLCAYIVPAPSASAPGNASTFTITELRKYLSAELPEHMIPSYFIELEKLPLTPNGKVDRKKLPEPEPIRPQLGVTYVAPETGIEKKISDIWKNVLNLDKVGVNDSFFDLGGTSFDIIKIMSQLYDVFKKDIPVVSIFRYPTIRSFVEYLRREERVEGDVFKFDVGERAKRSSRDEERPSQEHIAVIGMSGRFPGAKNIDEFWENLYNGVESIPFFSTEELEASSGGDLRLLYHPDYVKAKGIIGDVEYFDAAFFNYTPNEAEIMDPQLRILHECSWEALENAGYDPESYNGLIGVYIGNATTHYWITLAYLNNKSVVDTGFLTNNYSTIISYKLNLCGPSVIVQTACSTSLVAIHLASQGLINHECDMALAGGVSIWLPEKDGYIYQEGMIYSKDGHCRTFDARAAGTVFGNGAGIAVLKRLEDAIADGDTITAVIKGSGINNDGRRKVGLASPSVDGQAEIIRKVYQESGIDPESISYVEAHGTGTILGDPVELEALKLAFNTSKRGYCRIGSVKTNVGHLNVASGIAGFIKTVLALKHRMIPPSLNFEIPNPKIDFENSPFIVNTELTEWKTSQYPLRAGVSAFGIGGTNAHLILEEAPESKPSDGKESRPLKMIMMSASAKSALEKMTENLANYLKRNPTINLADVAYTLQVGRKACKLRKMVLCSDIDEAVERLTASGEALSPETGNLHKVTSDEDDRPVVFMFSGQGAQYVNMGLELYKTEPVFRAAMDRCFDIIKPIIEYDIKEILYPDIGDRRDNSLQEPPATNNSQPATSPEKINQTEITQPILFIFEYALARLLLRWGITPYAMIGHSIGEYVAACLSGVFSLEDAIKLVVLRGKLMQQMPTGSMLGVSMTEEALIPLLTNQIALAAVNTTANCVVSGPHEVIDSFEKQLKEKGHNCRRLHTSHAFHSTMMDPILDEFEQTVRGVTLNKPLVPYISNVTGKWITVEEATNPAYWVKHLRRTVRFADGLTELLKEPSVVFLEVGPGRTLSTFVRQHKDKKPEQLNLNLIRHPKENVSETYFLLSKIGRLWLNGKKIDWQGFYSEEKRHRISLPTYPFQRQRYWLEGNPFKISMQESSEEPPGKRPDVADWFYIPSWKGSVFPGRKRETSQPAFTKSFNWVIFMNENAIGAQLEKTLRAEGQDVVIVKSNGGFASVGNNEYTINPAEADDYHSLMAERCTKGKIPNRIVHLWNLTENGADRDRDSAFYSLLYLAQAIGKENLKDEIQLTVLTDRMQAVLGDDIWHPQTATVIGALQVIPQEYPNIRCRNIDIDLTASEPGLAVLLKELSTSSRDTFIAFRDNYRWVRTFEPFRLEKPHEEVVRLREGGVYLVTGGLGGIGLVLAQYLAKTVNAKLILTGRTALPPHQEWDEWLNANAQNKDNGIGSKIQKVQQLEASGAEVLVFSADVSNPQQMQEVVTRAEEKFGKMNGVIHSAGVPDGGLIQLRSREMSEQVFTPKIEGTLVLDSLLKDTPLDFFMLCSSISAITAPLGQVAYSAANAFLDNFAHYKTTKDNTFTISVNWDAWQEVGMAVEALKQSAAYISPKVSEPQGIPVSRVLEVDHPLFDRCEVIDSDQVIYISHLKPNKDWVLDEHRIKDKATLPGTGYLEMARAAVEHHAKNGRIELKEFLSLSPLVVAEDEEKEMRTILKKNGDNYTLSFISRVKAGEDGWMEHARGTAACLKEQTPRRYPIEEIETACDEQEIMYHFEDFVPTPGAITFGPRWNNLRRIKYSKNQALGFLELPGAFARDTDSYKLHPALLDVGNAVLRRVYTDDNAYVPVFYQRLEIKGDLPAKVFFHVKGANSNRYNAETLRYNVTIMDDKGTELVNIEDYTLKIVKVDSRGVERFSGQSVRASSLQETKEQYRPFSSFVSIPASASGYAGMDTNAVSSQGYQSDLLKDAISPVEGIDIFTRVLGAEGLSQVVVSTIDLSARMNKDRDEGGPRKRRGQELQEARPSLIKHARPELSTDYKAPRTEVEKKLAPIWEELLGIDQVGIYDDFFELGGDSLKAVNFGARIQKEFDTEVSISEFFSRPNIKQLAEYIEEISGVGTFYTIEPVEAKEYYPLSPAQKRLYIQQQIEPESTVYNIPTVRILEGDIDMERVEDTFAKLIKRHESLRTSFEIVEKEAVQRVHAEVGFKIENYETKTADIKTEVEETINHFVRPFDLSAASQLRVGVVKVSAQKLIFIIDMHHIIADAFSHEIFPREFFLQYNGEELPELRLQYRDYSVWKNSDQVKETIKKQGEYWKKQFEGDIPVLNLPTDYPRPAVQSFEGRTVGFKVGKEETEALKKIAVEKKVTLYMVLLALYNVFLSKLCGQENIVVGADMAGRTHSDLEPIIGMFVNTLALKNSPAPEKTFKAFLEDVKESTLNALENQDYPFEDLVEHVSKDWDPSRNPIFDVFFSFMDSENAPSEIHQQKDAHLKEERYMYENTTAKFDLLLTGMGVEEQLFFAFEYRTKLFKNERIQQFITYFKEIIASVIKNPDARIWEIEMLTEKEKKRLLKAIRDEKGKENEHIKVIRQTQKPSAPSEAEGQVEFDF